MLLFSLQFSHCGLLCTAAWFCLATKIKGMHMRHGFNQFFNFRSIHLQSMQIIDKCRETSSAWPVTLKRVFHMAPKPVKQSFCCISQFGSSRRLLIPNFEE